MTASGSAALIARAPSRSTSTSTGRPAASSPLDRLPRGAGALQPAVDLGPLQQLAALDQPVETGRADEVVVGAVDLARARVPGGRRDAEVQLREPPAQLVDHAALADAGRAGQHDQPAARRVGAGAGALAATGHDRTGPGRLPRHVEVRRRPRLTRTEELGQQRLALPVAEPAQPPGRGDLEPLHDLRGAHLADPGQRLEQRRHLHLAQDLVAVGLLQHLAEGGPAALEAVLQLGPGPTRRGRLLERGCTLFLGQLGKGHGSPPSFVAHRGDRPGASSPPRGLAPLGFSQRTHAVSGIGNGGATWGLTVRHPGRVIPRAAAEIIL